MYNGIGLTTPRGTGTNGYVQRNIAFISNLKEKVTYKSEEDFKKSDAVAFKEPNKEILLHEKKRKVELKCFEMELKMEEQGVSQEEIDITVSKYRAKLLAEMNAEVPKRKMLRDFEPHDGPQYERSRLLPKGTHETAAVNILKNNVFKDALGISEAYKDGTSMAQLQERKKADEAKKILAVQSTLKELLQDLCDGVGRC